MAEKIEISEDDLTCPICVEVFREPVLLSCQHSFCRDCLQLYSAQTETSAKLDHVIICPVCRSSTDLGDKGVAGLPVQLALANIADKLCGHKRVVDETPKCSICENGDSKPAVKCCLTCAIFYCEECVTALHPMKGELRRHKLILAEEYICRKKTTGTARTTDCVMDTSELCDVRGLQYLGFYGPCQQRLCIDCFDDHDGHITDSFDALYRKNLTNLDEKTSALKQFKAEVEKMLKDLARFQADVKEKKSRHVAEIERASKEAIASVNEWRRDCLKIIEMKHEEWLLACCQVMKGLKLQTEQIEDLIQSCDSRISGSRDHVVKGHPELTTRIDDLSSDLRDSLQRHRDMATKWRHEMNSDLVMPRKLHIRDNQISTPKLTFIESFSDGVNIRERGKMLARVDNSTAAIFNGAMTNGRLQAGRHYWELDITFTVKETPRFIVLIYSAGVVQKVPSQWYVGGCNYSWGVHIKYRNNQWMFGCRHYQYQTTPIPVYPEGVTETGTIRQGFYLNCEERTLTILDCANNRALYTFTDLDISKPLTPAVSVSNYDGLDVSVRITQGNLSNLVKALPNLL